MNSTSGHDPDIDPHELARFCEGLADDLGAYPDVVLMDRLIEDVLPLTRQAIHGYMEWAQQLFPERHPLRPMVDYLHDIEVLEKSGEVVFRKVTNREAREYLRQIARALRARYGRGKPPGMANARQPWRQGITARIDPLTNSSLDA